MKHNQNGFSVLLLGFTVFLTVVVGFAGWRVYETRLSTQTSGDAVLGTLTGIVTMGPTTPVCETGKSCASTVNDHIIEALNLSGNVAATSKTDGSGRYSMRLQPGRYTLVLVPQIGLGQATNNQINVKAGTSIYNLVVDTGIR